MYTAGSIGIIKMEHVKLRNLNNVLYMRVPVDFVREHDLSEDDSFIWVSGEDGARLKIVSPEMLEKIMGTEEPADTAPV
jgi:hypothetical protein